MNTTFVKCFGDTSDFNLLHKMNEWIEKFKDLWGQSKWWARHSFAHKWTDWLAYSVVSRWTIRFVSPPLTGLWSVFNFMPNRQGKNNDEWPCHGQHSAAAAHAQLRSSNNLCSKTWVQASQEFFCQKCFKSSQNFFKYLDAQMYLFVVWSYLKNKNETHFRNCCQG